MQKKEGDRDKKERKRQRKSETQQQGSAATVAPVDAEQNACVSVPTVQEQVIVQEIPELQVVEQKLEQAVEAMQVKLLERVQQRAAEHSKRLFGRLEEFHKEFHKHLERCEARRAENDVLIKEIGVLWKERKQQERGQLNGSVLETIPEHP